MIISSDWTKECSYGETLGFLKELAIHHASKAHHSDRERLITSISNDNFLCLFDDRPSPEATAEQFYHFHQCIAFFKKLECLDVGVDREAVAFQSWLDAESSCSLTNEILQKRRAGSFFFEPGVDEVFYLAQRKIARVLGDLPSIESLKLRYGPGATTVTKKRDSTPSRKISDPISCSEDLLPILSRVLEEVPHLCDLHSTSYFTRLSDREECLKVSVCLTDDVLEFVPKSAKTYRAITKTASLNSMVQNGYGDYIAHRLRALAGIDIRDQTVNQRLAKQGSLDGKLATIDLSSASDTISTELVYELLPLDWAITLDMCRVKHVTYKGKRFSQEKFCSMGNGFTFPLETLIFWALSRSASEVFMRDNPSLASEHFGYMPSDKSLKGPDLIVSVYGDDIIAPSCCFNYIERILRLAGFKTNISKSFFEGKFRESCGKDYYSGIDVRPVFTKNLLSQFELFRLHNYYARSLRYEERDLILKSIHPSLRIFGPDGFGDGHLLGDWHPRPHKKAQSHGYGGVIFDTLTLRPRRNFSRDLRPGDRILPLYTIYVNNDAEEWFESPPDSVEGLTSYLRITKRSAARYASLPLPDFASPSGDTTKVLTLPGKSKGYKRISIYTLDKVAA